jgi:transposase
MPEPQQISRKHRWKVQGRVAVLAYVSAHGLKPAAERFGLDRKTVREWRDRAKAAGEAGLVPRYPRRRPRRIPDATVSLIEEARREFGWGACRTRLWLLRVHQIKVAAKTIARICVDLGLPAPRALKRRGGRRGNSSCSRRRPRASPSRSTSRW